MAALLALGFLVPPATAQPSRGPAAKSGARRNPATGGAISDARAVNAIIGEAENQGYNGMLAVAYAIRNRGTLRGVYGEHSPRVKKAGLRIRAEAAKAWKNSQMRWGDITGGATHWENVKAFGRPYWTASMVPTVLIGDHQFYRPK